MHRGTSLIVGAASARAFQQHSASLTHLFPTHVCMRMQKHENWESYHCKTSKTYCTSDRYEKQMHGCCPATCGKCESKSSATNATEDQCKDDDKCLQKNEDWESHVCSTSKKYCERTRYAIAERCFKYDKTKLVCTDYRLLQTW